jgi:hypothetical protein
MSISSARPRRLRAAALALAGALLIGSIVCATPPGSNDPPLPRFTETREAAALFFLKKHAPEALPLLEQLRKANPAQYRQEIREVFQATELLADLEDDPQRQELELKIWKTESKAYALVARLSTPDADERKRVEASLQEVARELVDLDIQVLELKADQLDKELGEVKDELARARDQTEKNSRDRYRDLVNKVKGRKK